MRRNRASAELSPVLQEMVKLQGVLEGLWKQRNPGKGKAMNLLFPLEICRAGFISAMPARRLFKTSFNLSQELGWASDLNLQSHIPLS